MQQVEAFQEQNVRASGRRRMRHAATHDAGAQDYHVEVETPGGAMGAVGVALGLCYMMR